MTIQDAVLSSGTLATLTGITHTAILDNIQAVFLEWFKGREDRFERWQEAWEAFVEDQAVDFLTEDIREEDVESFAAYVANLGSGVNLETALDGYRDNFAGVYDSLEEWAEDYADSTGMLESIPQHLRNYFDFEAFARDAEINGDIYALDLEGGKLAVFHNG